MLGASTYLISVINLVFPYFLYDSIGLEGRGWAVRAMDLAPNSFRA